MRALFRLGAEGTKEEVIFRRFVNLKRYDRVRTALLRFQIRTCDQ